METIKGIEATPITGDGLMITINSIVLNPVIIIREA